ncbi:MULTISPECIES: helix-turn-helix transcriptional regulator [unclassified Dehalobacter]|uniref:substrate-binding domain-containing protein n=1 Tax=unclassified Dehalobacter TaxID=2635733 RepID=UPI00028BB491|nr:MULTISPECIES: helix-turn-helix transcriptional regulator [unclassified Dehalobacter]AFV01176.1 putative molybdate-responsive regulator YvgK in bacilli [Dehalobacter sp. DCA]AFV04219.1 putative molybdate-responsive regulator YvgK in bacilli [Dehalobacter sp. CF]
MTEKKALSTQDVAAMLHVSKSTIYDLIRKGEISSYKVGRKVRFTENDVQDYISRSKKSQSALNSSANNLADFSLLGNEKKQEGFIICGQDLILDILSNYMRLHNIPALRAYIGSYDSLVSLYRNKINVASTHLWDSDTDQYNVPYVRRLLPGVPTVIIHLTCRIQGLYVAKGNPKGIMTWADFGRDDITMINREYGAGSRVLLDENLKLLGIYGSAIKGYKKENQSHLAVASAISSGQADVAVGNEKMARQVDNIDFIPLKKERYDLVVKKEDFQSPEVQTMLNIIRSAAFKNEFANIGGYDTSDMGKIVAEI